MKQITLLSALIIAMFTVFAQEAEVKKENGPQISFEDTTHDYGEIELGSDGAYEFVFTNTGNEPLILSKPRSSCGCTVPSWPKEPILPGESNNIKVTYNTNKAGNFNKTVTVYSNAKGNSTVVLRIKGKVLAQAEEALPTKENSMGAAPVNK